MKTKLTLILATLAWLSTLNPQLSAAPLGTAFTYQGRLNDGANPATGIYDLQFTIYDSLASGSVVGGPLTNSATGVTNGLFTVALDFGAGAFTGDARWLEIGVRINGGGAFTTLIPRQPITATPYAVTAGAVTGPINGSSIVNGSITSAQLAPGAVTAVNIATNSITATQLASGAAAANLNAISQSGVASGGLVLSATENAALVNAGYVRIGATTTADAWQQRVNGTPPAARRYHTAVWTGSELIVWGGTHGSYLNDGGRYNPAGNSWTAVSTTGAPAARQYHTAVWTGSEMIVWGGAYYDGSSHYLNDGGRYNPAGNSWTAVSTTGAPAARGGHTAVWTGSELIVWGGVNGVSYLNDGGRYNPAGNSWTAVSTTGAPAARYYHTAVWTGSELIVWGGYGNSGYLNDTFSYTPGRVLYLYQRP
jgi:hypothetical protein